MIEISESVTLYWDSSNHRWVFMAEGAPMQDIKNALYFTEFDILSISYCVQYVNR